MDKQLQPGSASFLEQQTAIHTRYQQATETLHVADLRCKKQSCATCKYKKEIKFMQYCVKLDKYVKDYNICAYHKAVSKGKNSA